LEIDGEDQKDLRDLIKDTFGDVYNKVEKKMRGQLKDLGLPDL
jgi:DNA-binding protein YbaB